VPFIRQCRKYGRAGQSTDDNIIRRVRFECCITKATDTHTEYAILTAFLRQQWLRERASMLCYRCLHRLSSYFLLSRIAYVATDHYKDKAVPLHAYQPQNGNMGVAVPIRYFGGPAALSQGKEPGTHFTQV
jgi:hypothetical protein